MSINFLGGVSWRGHRANRLAPCSRELKLLRPICKTCEDAAGGAQFLETGWYERCEHDPYVSIVEKKTTQPIYEDICATCGEGPAAHRGEAPEELGADATEADLEVYLAAKAEWDAGHDFAASGQKRIVGTETISSFEPKPNWVSITHAGGMNKGRGLDRALRRGFIYPQQLRSPVWPNGIKMRCMFRECYSEDLKKFDNGWFCRKIEAQLVKVSDSEETWEVGQFSRKSDQLQQKILDRMAV